jgi:hypothetical protein
MTCDSLVAWSEWYVSIPCARWLYVSIMNLIGSNNHTS